MDAVGLLPVAGHCFMETTSVTALCTGVVCVCPRGRRLRTPVGCVSHSTAQGTLGAVESRFFPLK